MVTSWTPITKPSGNPYTVIPNPTNGQDVEGTPIGLLLALTREIVTPLDPWIRIDENGASWTDVPKATNSSGFILGPELITNGTFTGSAGGWSLINFAYD